MSRKSLLVGFVAVVVFVAAPKSPQRAAISLVRAPNGGIEPQALVDRSGTLYLLYFAGTPRAAISSM